MIDVEARHIRRFLVVGGLSVGVDLAIYAGLSSLGLCVPLAKGISYVCGMGLGFVLNKTWTFQSRHDARSEAILYACLYVATLGINVLANQLLLAVLGSRISPGWAGSAAFLVATGLTTVLNYLGMRFVAFRRGITEHGRVRA